MAEGLVFTEEKEAFFRKMDDLELALSADDVRMRTRSGLYLPLPPEGINTFSKFSENVELKVPFVSAAMDTVTESRMAIAMARLGGLGVIHGAMTIDRQYKEVRSVKLASNGMIEEPIHVSPDDTLEQVENMRKQRGFEFKTFPVVDADGKFVGVVSGDHFKYARTMDASVRDIMKLREDAATADVGTTLEQAYDIMLTRQISTLPVINDDSEVKGMYVFSDVSRIVGDSEQYNVDSNHQLFVAAAVSTGADLLERVDRLDKVADAFVFDSADGDSHYMYEAVKLVRKNFKHLTADLVVGNISDGKSAVELVQVGANGVKVGQGPGSICTTRRETGIGMPQVSAVSDVIRNLGTEFAHIPVCADGGIKDHGDIPIYFASGAHSVMMGRKLAGTRQAPGMRYRDKSGNWVKQLRGMGSAEALADNESSRQRYDAKGTGVMLAEGVSAEVPYDGELEDVLELCRLALVKGMSYVKAYDIPTHRRETRLKRITGSGLRESHPHDVTITG